MCFVPEGSGLLLHGRKKWTTTDSFNVHAQHATLPIAAGPVESRVSSGQPGFGTQADRCNVQGLTMTIPMNHSTTRSVERSGNPAMLRSQLEKVIRRGRVLTSPAQLAGYDADGLGYKTFRPDAVVIPADAEELVELLKASQLLNVPVTMRGAGTSLSGGPVAAQGGIVVHTSSLRKVRTVCAEGFWCEVECSCVLNQLDAALIPYGLFYPPDPSSGPVCTLGGNVAMNAGGAHCFRYGVTSNYVLGVEVILLDGTVHRFGGPAGGRGDWREDWKRLMVGSEGTLGAFTRFWLRLLPRPEKAWTYRATFPDLSSAEKAIHALAAHASFPVAIELMDPRCVALVENSPMAVGLPKDSFLIVTEIDGPAVLVDARAQSVAELLTSAGASSVEFSDDETQRKKLWRARKVAGGLMGQMSPDFLVQDAVIPKRALAELLQLVYDEADAAGVPAVNVFHAGDGNLHPNFLFDSGKPGELEKVEAISKRLMQRVVAVGGTLSGEHGIGNDKTAYMPLVFGADNLKLQLAVPKLFNPNHQLNPLKVFASRRFAGSAEQGGSMVDACRNDALQASPTFVPFLDAVDGTICCSADVTAEELHAQCQPHRLRYPFVIDSRASLKDQVAASGFGPASSRFGPLCDNIMGMNWRLPDGRIVRVGERVVKSTTGYDLLRFLLNSDRRFGEPVDFVLRLRPASETTSLFWITGNASGSLAKLVSELTATCWIHWFDSVDVLFDRTGGTFRVRIALNCPSIELPVYEQFLAGLAASHGLQMTSDRDASSPVDGCPDFVLKTTPDRVLSLAARVSAEAAVDCVALCYNGVVHGYLRSREQSSAGDKFELSDPKEKVESIILQHARSLLDAGGDWHSRHIPREVPQGLEAKWLTMLEQEFGSL